MFIWKIGGEAGFGIMNAGLAFARAFSRNGYWAYVYPEYPSLIRGGNNTIQVIVDEKEVNAPRANCDVLVALDQFTLNSHKECVRKGGAILYDPASAKPNGGEAEYIPIEFSKIALEAGGLLYKNIVAVAASLAVFGAPLETLYAIIEDEFRRKGEKVVNENKKAAEMGYRAISKRLSYVKKIGEPMPVLSGNHAIALGGISAGLNFYAAYPMTPASSILHVLAEIEKKHNIVVKQVEDEIAAMNMAIGASYAGARAMVGTSGGGFALMTEGMSLAGLSEIPITVVLAQRTGPSTGMPTWTEQADLLFALYSGHGDFPKVVIAPGDHKEAFELTGKALNIAEKYQVQVILLSDKFLSESWKSERGLENLKVPIERGKILYEIKEQLGEGERFKRYKFTDDGVSPRPIPGVKNGRHVATSYEHWENGFSTEHFKTRKEMVDKRAKKLETLRKDIELPKTYGNGEKVLVCWGSSKMPVLDALPEIERLGYRVVHFSYVYPIPIEAKKALKGKKLVALENNSTAQFSKLLKSELLVEPDAYILRYDARPFFVEDVIDALKKVEAGEKKVVVFHDTPYEPYTLTKVVE
ncbi:MAG: 2-oxoacid:acceptor oxidoreductase subunit alpha [Candidatus Anstonellales archaeon]